MFTVSWTVKVFMFFVKSKNKFYQLRSKAKHDLIHYLEENNNKNTVAWTQFSIFQKRIDNARRNHAFHMQD